MVLLPNIRFYHPRSQYFALCATDFWGYGDAGGWDIALQVGRSRVRFLMVSLEFFIDIILDYDPGVDSASNGNEYQEYFLGVKAAGA